MTNAAKGTILVTGGAGFIGCAVSDILAPVAARFVVLDRLHPQVHPNASRPSRLHPAAELVVGDVTDRSVWAGVLDSVRPNLVIHLAAETGTAQSLTEASRHASVNVVGTTRMLDAFSSSGMLPDRIVLCSSRAIYGEGRWRRSDGTEFYPGQRSHEQLEAGQWDFPDATPLPSEAATTEPRPTSVYGATKLAQEHVLTTWCLALGVEPAVLRLQNVYGPGQSLTNSYTGIVALFSQLAIQRRAIPVYEDGQITRDFVYIDDVAQAVAAAVSAPEPPISPLDVGSGRETTILELAQLLAQMHGAPAPEINGRYRDGDVRYAACRIVRSGDVLGWEPKWELEDGLGSLQNWIQAASLRRSGPPAKIAPGRSARGG